MIAEMDLRDDRVAAAVHRVGLAAYRVEAALIGFDGIPALREDLAGMRARPLRWLGCAGRAGLPVAFLAWTRTAEGDVDIDRVCVDPSSFRQGIAGRLLTHLLATETGGDVLVSTGAANSPAVALYARHGFKRVGMAMPAPGLVVTRFRLDR